MLAFYDFHKPERGTERDREKRDMNSKTERHKDQYNDRLGFKRRITEHINIPFTTLRSSSCSDDSVLKGP